MMHLDAGWYCIRPVRFCSLVASTLHAILLYVTGFLLFVTILMLERLLLLHKGTDIVRLETDYSDRSWASALVRGRLAPTILSRGRSIGGRYCESPIDNVRLCNAHLVQAPTWKSGLTILVCLICCPSALFYPRAYACVGFGLSLLRWYSSLYGLDLPLT